MSIRETPEEVDRRLALERRTVEIARKVKADLPPGTGFTLFLFNFGEGGNLAYVSTGEREDVVKAIREWLARVDGGRS